MVQVSSRDPVVAPVQPPSGIGIESALEFRESVALGTPDGLVAGFGPSRLVIDAPPPAPAPVPQVLRAGGVIKAPMRTKDAAPVYQEIARANRVQGVVIVEATIGTDGRVTHATILRSVTLLDNAALDAVRSWEYTPTLLNGEPVTVVMTVTVHFTLN
jgi:periplasmic protein TonB